MRLSILPELLNLLSEFAKYCAGPFRKYVETAQFLGL